MQPNSHTALTFKFKVGRSDTLAHNVMICILVHTTGMGDTSSLSTPLSTALAEHFNGAVSAHRPKPLDCVWFTFHVDLSAEGLRHAGLFFWSLLFSVVGIESASSRHCVLM